MQFLLFYNRKCRLEVIYEKSYNKMKGEGKGREGKGGEEEEKTSRQEEKKRRRNKETKRREEENRIE